MPIKLSLEWINQTPCEFTKIEWKETPKKMGKMENIIGQLYNRDSKRLIPYNYRKKLIAKSRNCSYLTERCIEVPNTYNKIFASVWVNNDHVVVGTKCNRVSLWDIVLS